MTAQSSPAISKLEAQAAQVLLALSAVKVYRVRAVCLRVEKGVRSVTKVSLKKVKRIQRRESRRVSLQQRLMQLKLGNGKTALVQGSSASGSQLMKTVNGTMVSIEPRKGAMAKGIVKTKRERTGYSNRGARARGLSSRRIRSAQRLHHRSQRRKIIRLKTARSKATAVVKTGAYKRAAVRSRRMRRRSRNTTMIMVTMGGRTFVTCVRAQYVVKFPEAPEVRTSPTYWEAEEKDTKAKST